MSDFTTRTYAWCASNERWSQRYGEYTVTYGALHDPDAAYTHGYSCNCSEFKKIATCSHIKQAEANGDRCAWNEEMDPGDAPSDNRCPHCEGQLAFGTVAE